MNYLKSTGFLIFGIVCLSACNKKVSDEISTTNENVENLQSSINGLTHAYDVREGSSGSLSITGWNQTRDEKYSSKQFDLNYALASTNTVEEDIRQMESVNINGDIYDFSYVTQSFNISLYSNSALTSEEQNTLSTIEITLYRYINLNGITASQFETWSGEEVDKIYLSNFEYDLKQRSNDFDLFLADGVLNASGTNSYGMSISDFTYDSNSRDISFNLETKNEDEDNYDAELEVSVSTKIYTNIINSYRVSLEQ